MEAAAAEVAAVELVAPAAAGQFPARVVRVEYNSAWGAWSLAVKAEDCRVFAEVWGPLLAAEAGLAARD